MLGQELKVCGMGQPESFGGLMTHFIFLPPKTPIPLQLFEALSGQQGGAHTIKKAILFQTDKNVLQRPPHAHTATNKTF